MPSSCASIDPLSGHHLLCPIICHKVSPRWFPVTHVCTVPHVTKPASTSLRERVCLLTIWFPALSGCGARLTISMTLTWLVQTSLSYSPRSVFGTYSGNRLAHIFLQSLQFRLSLFCCLQYGPYLSSERVLVRPAGRWGPLMFLPQGLRDASWEERGCGELC